jgi:hypothetical protein
MKLQQSGNKLYRTPNINNELQLRKNREHPLLKTNEIHFRATAVYDGPANGTKCAMSVRKHTDVLPAGLP